MRDADMTMGSSSLLPAGSRLCVWMRAGLVAYKLCDRDFECDACPFDEVMRGQAPDTPGVRAIVPTPIDLAPASRPGLFPDDRRYHHTSTWATVAGPDRVRIGLDALMVWLAGEVTSVVLPVERALMEPGAAGCWLVDEWGTLPLRMPVRGPVVRTNGLLRARPRLAVEDPYGSGWLIEVACVDPQAVVATLESAAQARARTEERMRTLETMLAALLERGPALATTLADGGERLRDWRRILGPARYRREVLRLLG